MSIRSSRGRAAAALWLAVFAALSAASAAAAATHSAVRLNGRLTDAQHRPLPGVEVGLYDAGGASIATAVTDATGIYRFAAVAPGRYLLQAHPAGYAPVSREISVGRKPRRLLDLAAHLQLQAITVTARFERARNALSPSTGSSQYRLDAKAIQTLPQGANTPIDGVLLQYPGVVGDSQGQLHVRGDHGDLQFRINGVILPEGATGFGNALGARFADSITLLTGALPAQYGDRTAGIVDVTTKQHFDGGQVDLYGGAHATFEPSLEYGRTFADGASVYLTGSYLRSDLGTEAPTAAYTPIHGGTEQGRGFGYLSLYPTQNLRLSLMAGTDYNSFQIPNTPGVQPNPDFLRYAGAGGFDSADLKENQFERTQYGIVALQGLLPQDGSWQTALFERESSVVFEPDPVGDLVFNGVAARVKRKSRSFGMQGDLSLPLGRAHTLRTGLEVSTEDDRSDDTATVFPTDALGNPNGAPLAIVDNNPKNGNTLLAFYLQDQWNLSQALTVNYGLRYDRINAFIDSAQLSPRLGLVWHAGADTTVHAGYARYFTPPPNELVANATLTKFAGTSNAPEVMRNDPVKAERADYFDLGVAQQVTPRLNLGLDSYYKFARNLIDEGQLGQSLILTPFNYRFGRIYGLELTAAYHRGAFSAYLNLARSVAKATQIVSGQFNFAADELAYIATHNVFLDHQQLISGSAGAAYVWRGTTVSLDATYSDGLRRGFANTGKQTPYTVVNLGITHGFHWFAAGPTELRLTVVNLTDRSYQIHDGSGIGIDRAQFGERRGLYLGLTQSFR
ncbi:MAG: TonB-dependent receptor [Gammaproteobacteria bacterium]|nr:TonB-dependent receptor [Gammaproteobacteria bacterium]